MVRSDLERVLRGHFERQSNVVAVYLFGSVARGQDRPNSDVDVGVLYRAPLAATLLAQPYADEAQLSDLFGKPVQIVAMNQAPVDLVHRILREGVLLLDRDPSARIAFEVHARNAYFDLLPTLRRYRDRATA
jgi:predicted nucleotidyltransferase